MIPLSQIVASFFFFFFLMIRRPPRSTLSSSSAASDVYKRQVLAIFRFFRCVRIIRLYRLQDSLSEKSAGNYSSSTTVKRQLASLAFAFFCFVFISSGLVHACDQLFSGEQFSGAVDIQFHEAFYYIIVTITTVGYGEIYPQTTVSQMLMVVIIVAAFTILPAQVSKLNETLNAQSQYDVVFTPRNSTWEHVVVVGPPTERGIDAHIIKALLENLVDQHHADVKLQLVVLSPYDPTPEVLKLLNSGKYDTQLTYVRGSVFDENSLRRVKAESAKAFFVFVDKYNSGRVTKELDTIAIMSVLVIKRFNDSVEVFVELNSESSKKRLQNFQLVGVWPVCLEELRNGILAHSCSYPGLSTMLMNMVQDYEVKGIEQKDQWLQQYLWGATQRLCSVDVSCFAGLPFCLTVQLCLTQFDLLLIAVQECSTNTVWRNPTNKYVVAKGDTGFVLSHARVPHNALNRSSLLRSKEFKTELSRAMESAEIARLASVEMTDQREPAASPREAGAGMRSRRGSTASVDTTELETCVDHLEGHIVVLGSLEGCKTFITPFRASQSEMLQNDSLWRLRPIVIVSGENDSVKIKSLLRQYSRVYHFTGKLDDDMLRTVGVERAKRVVILRDSHSHLTNEAGLIQNEDMTQVTDAENVFTYRNVLRLCGRMEIPIVELIHVSNQRFMSLNRGKCPPNHRHQEWPLYAAGQVFSTSTFDNLFSQGLFTPGLIDFFASLGARKEVPKCRLQEVQDSVFVCLPVPSIFAANTYEHMLRVCLEEYEVVCLGLYRSTMASSRDSQSPRDSRETDEVSPPWSERLRNSGTNEHIVAPEKPDDSDEDGVWKERDQDEIQEEAYALAMAESEEDNSKVPHPYVYTNPHPLELLVDGDMVFVLAQAGFSFSDTHKQSAPLLVSLTETEMSRLMGEDDQDHPSPSDVFPGATNDLEAPAREEAPAPRERRRSAPPASYGRVESLHGNSNGIPPNGGDSPPKPYRCLLYTSPSPRDS
eukprot:TRINITY_DN10206_c0_g2_i5.p1 TRINITY_DN10206_c0_g2~~TRINITY_DN10206_c0_g2_i5.p1  ORF type:complete len:991 (+),score=268.33 TRINITY_DN10206_c0_g2_i5:86-3058(+)